MLHKAATSFSPFKLQHLHAHVRSALNLNLGSNATNNVNWQNSATANAGTSGGAASSGSGSSSSLGSSASQAGGSAGSAKWHAGRSYSQYTHGRNNSPAPNATASSDGSGPSKLLDDEEDSKGFSSKAKRNKSWKEERPSLSSRQRSSSLSTQNRAATTGKHPAETSGESALPRSTPYSYTQEELQARYATRQAFASQQQQQQQQRKAPQLLLTLPGASLQIARPISTSAKRSIPLVKSQTRPSTPVRDARSIRRNSTSAVEAASASISEVPLEVLQSTKGSESENVTSSPEQSEAAHAAVEEASQPTRTIIERYPPELPDFSKANAESLFKHYAIEASHHQDVSRIRLLYKLYRQQPEHFTAFRHSHLMATFDSVQAYADISGELTELWEDFSKYDMVPDKTAHSAMIGMLANQSLATDRLLKNQQLRNNAARLGKAAEQWAQGMLYDLSGSAEDAATDAMHSESSLAALKQQSDEDYASAKKLLISLGQEGREIRVRSLGNVLAAASTRGDIDTALTAFGFLERGPDRSTSRASAQSFKHLLLTYVKAGEAKGANTVFNAFKRGQGRYNRYQRGSAEALLDSEEITSEAAQKEYTSANAAVHVWNAMIYGNVMLGEAPSALELLETMMSPDSNNTNNPKPDNATLLSLIQGFSESGDLESAFRWASKIHAQPPPEDLPQPPPRLEDTLNTIIAAASTASIAEIGKMQDAANLTPLLPGLGIHIRLLAGITAPSSSQQQQASETSPKLPMASPSSSNAQSSFELGSVFSDPTVRSQSLSITPPPLVQNLVPESERVQLDLMLSMKVDDLSKTNMNPIDIYGIIKAERREGVHAYPETLGRLIEKLASVNAVTELEDLYLIAYNNLRSLPTQAEQSSSWAYLEDRMLIAMAKLGELGKAAMHRDRLLEAGSAPSADAYAAMITSAKDTTDDATVALELFEEARRFGVVPNLFLFNIVISKLSRARRTHLALSYFEQMKAIGLRPSAVTYGSVIAACCRTGDEKAATFLFNEMTKSPGFRPRVPPYNTMMQFYVNTQPDREKALQYFDAMLRTRVHPTGHTYKLLLDAYGSIEPVDMASVDDVFARLVNDRNVEVTGVHWASLLNAYGTVQKDVDRAIEIFESIAEHPASQGSKQPLPDVICYEALFNVFLANERLDLINKYREAMEAHFVRPTAYVYNTLIRAHAASGDIAQAREVFESLADPSSGVAATGNHASTESSDATTVYREPSTYDTMIRCELGVGEQAKAEALLERAVARAFPAAVLARMERLVKGEDKVGPLFKA